MTARNMHDAIVNNDLYDIKFLLEEGAEVNAKDDNGWEPLNLAVSYGDDSVIQLLIDHGANVNVKTHPRKYFKGDTGLTPLWLAFKSNNMNIIQLLNDYGAES